MSYPVVPGSRTQVLSVNDYTNCTAPCCLQNRVPLVAFDIWNELSGRQGRRGRAAGRSKKFVESGPEMIALRPRSPAAWGFAAKKICTLGLCFLSEARMPGSAANGKECTLRDGGSISRKVLAKERVCWDGVQQEADRGKLLHAKETTHLNYSAVTAGPIIRRRIHVLWGGILIRADRTASISIPDSRWFPLPKWNVPMVRKEEFARRCQS